MVAVESSSAGHPSEARSVWTVEPVGPLVGDVEVRGSKNAATKLMVAALLPKGVSEVRNAPQVGDVAITAGMLKAIGATVVLDSDSIQVDSGAIEESRVPVSYTGLNRIPILLIGPLLHRIGEAFIPRVGGDRLGARPVNWHVDALRQLGAEIDVVDEGIEAKATKLHGARIHLPFPSVGVTENILLTAVLAEGRTVIDNAAIEPEVVELALFLQRMGARIELRPDRRFVIEGVDHLNPARQRLGGDRIEAFSYLAAGLATGGNVRVYGCHQSGLVTAITILVRMGGEFEITDEYISVQATTLKGAALQTRPHPGFMTDWHPPIAVVLTQADGMSVIHETVFEDRFAYVEALRAMGAEIETFDQCLGGDPCRFHEEHFLHSAVIRGRTRLASASIDIPDVRGGFAYLIAAAAAEGRTTLAGVSHLERGYDRPLAKFSDLGLRIRVSTSEN